MSVALFQNMIDVLRAELVRRGIDIVVVAEKISAVPQQLVDFLLADAASTLVARPSFSFLVDRAAIV